MVTNNHFTSPKKKQLVPKNRMNLENRKLPATRIFQILFFEGNKNIIFSPNSERVFYQKKVFELVIEIFRVEIEPVGFLRLLELNSNH